MHAAGDLLARVNRLTHGLRERGLRPGDGLAVTMHYTSGTTGRPKGVRRELSGLDPDEAAELASLLPQLFGITPGPPNVLGYLN